MYILSFFQKRGDYSRGEEGEHYLRKYNICILKTKHSTIVKIKLLTFTSPAIVGRVKLDHNSKQQNAFERRANNY